LELCKTLKGNKKIIKFMKRLFNIFFCILRSKKIFSVEKKKFVIFDCTNSEILSKILPTDETYVISARVNLIKKLLINFTTLQFIIKNFFSRSIQLNYYISLILQLQPKLVITTIDNSVNFSILTKYFENKIKFIAIQNGTRGEFYENNNNLNKNFYFTNYFGFSNFDLELMKKNNIIVKNFFSVGSLTNSYFKKFSSNDSLNLNKIYEICYVGKRTFENGKVVSTKVAADSFILLKLLSRYVKKYNKSIILQLKSKKFNLEENNYIEKLFSGTNFKINLMDNLTKFNSYKNISSSKLVVGAPSSLLREASAYPNTKILCLDTEKKKDKIPFVGLNILNETSYEKFEERLNLLFNLNYEDYTKKLEKKHTYLMHNTNTIENLLEFFKKNTDPL
jgi:surface carbohydrate biosynthesis protein